MSAEVGVIAVVALLLSAILTGVVRRIALAQGVIDMPNARSSHTLPTPRGGGLAIVLTVTAALLLLLALGRMSISTVLALAGGGFLVALVGFIDDRTQLSARVRLLVHFVAAFWALACLGGLPPLRLGEHLIEFGWLGYPLGAIGIVWVLNLFNFMDGIDGIAGSEAAFVAISGAFLLADGAMSQGVAASAIVFGAACLGFLLWNLPPAKIFMGDVGSGFLGYFIAVIAVIASRDNPIAAIVWLILGAMFFTDATLTFLRRLLRGQRIYEAHRSHAYQWLARRWKSHARVTLLVTAVNVLWILPCAWIAVRSPRWAGWMLVAAFVPLVAGLLVAGAGRNEKT